MLFAWLTYCVSA